jgi:hypothetical protein
VGAAFLFNQGCFLVDTEVPLSRTGQTHELDDHHVVDVCGVGERFFKADKELLTDYAEPLGARHEVKRNVLRGVEVKVSRSDFRNGFYCSGCNYNYLLTPMRLVSPWELPRGVGLVEYNRYKFSVELGEERFAFRGLRVIRKTSFRKVGQHQIDNAMAHMVRRRHDSDPVSLLGELMEGHSENGYASP